MAQRTSLELIFAIALAVGACRSPQSRTEIDPPAYPPKPISCVSSLFPAATPAIYQSYGKPGFNSPEEVAALLEKRWSLADVRKFAIPERRHNDEWQNLVPLAPDAPEMWAGRLYCDKTTGFDSVEWYATVGNGRVKEYSLNAMRGTDSWLLEIGSPASVQQPPNVEPDFRKPYFVGHR